MPSKYLDQGRNVPAVYWSRTSALLYFQALIFLKCLIWVEAVVQTCSWGPVTLLKKRLWHRCFPVNFVKFLRTPFFIEHLLLILLFEAPVIIISSLKVQREYVPHLKRFFFNLLCFNKLQRTLFLMFYFWLIESYYYKTQILI